MANASCLCGGVKFTAQPENNEVGICHCSMCRKMSAGPYFGIACKDVEFAGDEHLGIYKSSDYGERLFCNKCGSTVAWRMQDKSMTVVAVDLIEGLDSLVLDHEIYIDHKPSYFSFAEKTKQMTEAEVMKMFAGGQEQ